MNRPSTFPDYKHEDCDIRYEDKDIRYIHRPDGTEAVGSKTDAGMAILERLTQCPSYSHYKVSKLENGDIYLIEEVI